MSAESCSGGAVSCAMGGAACTQGTCQKYVCTQAGIGIKSVVYACAPPVVPSGMCTPAANADGGGDVDGGVLPNGP